MAKKYPFWWESAVCVLAVAAPAGVALVLGAFNDAAIYDRAVKDSLQCMDEAEQAGTGQWQRTYDSCMTERRAAVLALR